MVQGLRKRLIRPRSTERDNKAKHQQTTENIVSCGAEAEHVVFTCIEWAIRLPKVRNGHLLDIIPLRFRKFLGNPSAGQASEKTFWSIEVLSSAGGRVRNDELRIIAWTNMFWRDHIDGLCQTTVVPTRSIFLEPVNDISTLRLASLHRDHPSF